MTSGVQVGSAYVALGADSSGLQSDLQKGESAVRGWASKLSGIFTTAGAGLTAGVTAPLLMLGNKAISQASDMAENMNKVNVVFGDAAKGVEAFSKNAATNLGMTSSEALAAAGTFGNLFTAMGTGQQEAAAMSTRLLTLAADLGSFNNLDPTEVLEKLRSGLTGEAEPLKSLGIIINETTVKTKAMAMGLGDAKGNLTEAEKAAARYALMLEQSKNAEGDFIETSGGLANATRIQEKQFEELLATIGTQLLPIKLQLVQVLQQVFTWFQALNPETQKMAVIFGAVAAAAGPVLIMLGMVAGAIATLGAPILLVIGALGLFAAAWATNFGGIREMVMSTIQPVIDAIQTAIGVFQALDGAGQTMSQSLIGAFTAFLGSLIGFEQASALVQKFREGWEQLAAFFEPTIERLKTGFAGMIAGLEPVGSKIGELVGAFEGLWTAVEPIVQMLAEVIGTVLVTAFDLLLEVAAAVMPDVGTIISTAIDIAVTVLNTLATVVTEVVTVVTALLAGDWASAWTGAQTILETLVTAAETILGKLITIVATILGDVLKGVMNFLTNLDSEWKNKLEGLLGVIRAKFYSILGTVIMMMGNIKGAVASVDLKQVGADIINGLKDGITGAAQGLYTEMVRVLGGLWQRAKDAVWAHSPSLLYAELGQNIIEGLSLGLTESQQLALDAMAKVFENLKNIADALSMLAGFRAAPGLLANLNTMIGQVKEIVASLQGLAEWLGTPGNPSVVSAKAGTDPLVEIANNIKAMVEGLQALGEFKPVGDVKAKVEDLVAGYKEVIAQFYGLALYLADSTKGLGDAVGALSVMAIVADSFGAIFQAWSAVAKAGSIAGPANMTAMLDSMVEMLKQVVIKLGALKLDISDELIDFAGRAADIAKAFGDIAKAWEAVSKFTAAKFDATAVVNWLADLSGNMLLAIERVQAWKDITPNETFNAFVTSVKAAIGLIADAAKAWEVIQDFEPNKGKFNLKVDQAVDWLASLAGIATRAIERVQAWGRITPNETFNAFVTSVKAAIGLIADAAKAWETIQNFEPNKGKFNLKVDQAVDWLASLAGLSVRAIERVQKWGGITPNETFNVFVTAIKNAIGLIADVAKAWESIRDFKPNAGKLDVNTAVDWLASLAGIATRAIERVQKWGGITPNDEFNAFTASIKNAMGALSETLKFVSDLGLWKHAEGVAGKMEALTTDLRIIIDQLNISYVNMRGFVNDSLLKFVADVSALTGGLANVVALLKSIEDMQNTGNIALAVARIKDMITAVLEGLKDIIYTIDEEKSGLISAFAQAMSALMGALKTALDLALAIPEKWQAPDAGMWSSFISWVMGVFQVFEQWVTQTYGGENDAEKLTRVGVFATALSNLMNAMKTALELALAVPDKWAAPDAGMWSAFITWTLSVFQVFEQWVTQNYSGEGGADRLNLTGTFATALNSLMGALKTALEMALAIPEKWAAPDPSKWSAFEIWVKGVFTSFAGYVQTNWGDEGGKGRLELVSLFGTALASLTTGIGNALQLAIAVPATWSKPDPTMWNNFQTWVQDVFTSFADYVKLHFTGPDAKAQLELVGAFSTAMSNLMGALKTALETALTLPEKWEGVPTGEGSPYASLKAFVEQVWKDFAAYVAANFPKDSAAIANLPVVKSFAEAMGAVMGALGSALDVMKGLQGYIPLLNSRITDFIGSVTFAYGLVQTYATGAGVQAGTAATKAFAEATSAVFTALTGALGLFKALVEPGNGLTASVDDFKTRLSSLVSRISIVLGAWKTYVETEANTTWTPVSGAFKIKIDGVFGTLKAALDLFKDLNTAGMPSPEKISAFLAQVLGLFSSFVTGIGTAPAEATTATSNTQIALAKAATDIGADAQNWYRVGYAFAGSLAAGWYDSMQYAISVNGAMFQSTLMVTDAIKAIIKKAFGIASPSTVMQGFGMNVAAGLGLGMLGGLPDVQAAAASLYQAAQPGMNLGGSWDVNNSRVITVRFEGQAGGGVPLTPQQFDALKSQLSYAVRIGA